MLSEFVGKKQRFATSFSVVLVSASLVAGVVLVGCGGGTGTSSTVATASPTVNSTPAPSPTPVVDRQTDEVPTTTRAKFSIDWSLRSRPGITRLVPSSAVSVVVTFPQNASVTGDVPVRIVVNRDPNRPQAYRGDYTATLDVLTGKYDAIITAFAEPDGTGSIVGAATTNATIVADGTGLGTVSTDGKVTTVAVQESPVIIVGDKKFLAFGASDARGNILLLTPGSAFFEIASGNDVLRLLGDQQVEALKPGSATVAVTVDGKKSSPRTINVESNAVLSVNPLTLRMATNDRRRLTATVTGAPDTSVTWSLEQTGLGGNVDANGTYTSPASPGTYGVRVTSNYDATKYFIVNVTVVGDNETIPLDPSLTGDLPITVK